MKKKILFVTYQPACANSFIVIANMLKKLQNQIAVVAVAASKDFWIKNDFSLINKSDELNKKEIYEIIAGQKPELVIIGTSHEDTVEPNFIKIAKEMGVKTVSFVDFWNKYPERFICGGKRVLPDKILVVDNIMQKEMIGHGFLSEIIEVVGNPHLENICENSKWFKRRKNDDDRIKIAFFSQPIAELYGYSQADINWLGYNEITIVEALIRCINKICEKKVKIELIINLHPREGDGELLKKVLSAHKNEISKKLSIAVVKMNSLKLINEVDLVLGMCSIVLLESVILGKSTLSIQINSNNKFKFVVTEHKMLEGIFDEKDLLYRLDSLCSQGKFPLRQRQKNSSIEYLYKNASERFCNACSELL